MPFARTGPIRRELRAALPERPFTVEFWDGTAIEATTPGGPTFSVRSPRAVAHALRAPGQLGIGRAYVTGDLEVDDIDRVMVAPRGVEAAGDRPQPATAPARRGAGGQRPHPSPVPSAGRASASGRPAHEGARRPLRPPPLRPAAGVLRPLPRRVDDLQLRDLLPRGDDARGGAGAEAGARLHQARPQPGRAICSTSAAAGAASPRTLPSTTASRSSGSRCRSRRPESRGSAPPTPASATGSRSG